MNRTNPTISIIIPVYNTEKYLRRCLDSIVAQTYKDFECILVDDGSTDASGKICDEYAAKDNRFKVFHKKNGGVSSARNLGLDNAKGEYIAFCDADDYVKENWLSEFILRIPICDIVVSGFEKTHCGKVQKKIYPYYNLSEPDLLWTILEIDGTAGFLWNKCFRTEIIAKENIRFKEKYKLWEDEEFISRYMGYTKKVAFGSLATYCYFEPNYGDKYKKTLRFEQAIDIYQNTKRIIPINSPLNGIYRLLTERIINSIGIYYRCGLYNKAYEALRKYHTINKEFRLTTSMIQKYYKGNHIYLNHLRYIILSLFHKI